MLRTFAIRVSLLAAVALTVPLAQPARAIDPKVLPSNSEIVFTLNLKQIIDSELVKNNKDLVNQAKQAITQKLEDLPAKKYLDKAGFDPLRDLHSITVASDGNKDVENAFIAIEGKFDPEKFVDAAKEASTDAGEKLKLSKIGNVNVFEISPKDNEKTIFAALVNDSLLLAASSKDGLTAAIGRATGSKSSALKDDLKKLLENVSGKQCLTVVATSKGLGNAAQAAPKQGGNIGAQLDEVDGIAFSINITKNITFQASGLFKNEESAKKSGLMINFLLTGARGTIVQQAKDQQQLQPVADIVNSLRLTTQGSSVVLRGEVTQANLEGLLALIPR